MLLHGHDWMVALSIGCRRHLDTHSPCHITPAKRTSLISCNTYFCIVEYLHKCKTTEKNYNCFHCGALCKTEKCAQRNVTLITQHPVWKTTKKLTKIYHAFIYSQAINCCYLDQAFNSKYRTIEVAMASLLATAFTSETLYSLWDRTLVSVYNN